MCTGISTPPQAQSLLMSQQACRGSQPTSQHVTAMVTSCPCHRHITKAITQPKGTFCSFLPGHRPQTKMKASLNLQADVGKHNLSQGKELSHTTTSRAARLHPKSTPPWDEVSWLTAHACCLTAEFLLFAALSPWQTSLEKALCVLARQCFSSTAYLFQKP